MSQPWNVPQWPYFWSMDWIVLPFCDCRFPKNFYGMDPDFGSYRDFRSPSTRKQRREKDKVKYYSYRGVHPSWIGQEYYTLQLVSSAIHAVRIKSETLRYLTPSYHVTHVIEKEEPALFAALINSGSPWTSLLPCELLFSPVPLAVAQARAADATSYPVVSPDPETTSPNTDASFDPEDPDHPRSIERVPIDPPGPFPKNMPDSLHLKLRVKTWTKRDNFDTKEHFSGGPDRRHHRGKRNYREKHNQKWGEKELGRGQKQRSKGLWNEIFGYPTTSHDLEFLRFSFPEFREDLYDPCDLAYQDSTVYWDGDEMFLGSNWRDIDGDAWEESEYYGDHWSGWIDEVAVVHKVLDWRELGCDYEGMAECEEDTISVDSDVVVLEHVVDVDADVDAMSDLAEVIVQEEWDRLSQTSSNESQGFAII